MIKCTKPAGTIYFVHVQLLIKKWCTCTILAQKTLYMYKICPISTHFLCTCTLLEIVHFSMYRKDVQFWEPDTKANVQFFLFRCTTRCTDFNIEKRGHVRALDAITLEEARQIPQNSTLSVEFCASGSALVKCLNLKFVVASTSIF